MVSAEDGAPSSTAAPARPARTTAIIAVLAAVGVVVVSMMQTLMVPLLPRLPRLLNTDATGASWVLTATLLSAAVANPVFGRWGTCTASDAC
ncbi:hypothetical protein FAIPA1_200019 [Frankia sp. AiPs1]|nr:hypothetical protein [Frankia sp. AiPa1]